MKKVMLFILAVLLVLPVFSQANPMSILYAYTGGLFQNLFDLEFQPTATFGGTEADLLFAGLGHQLEREPGAWLLPARRHAAVVLCLGRRQRLVRAPD